MASEGLRFTQPYAGRTVCAPSRCCLMTECIPATPPSAATCKPETEESVRSPIEMTVAAMLKGAGIRTGLFGKWGLGGAGYRRRAQPRGFDDWFGYLNQRHAHNSYPELLWDNQNEPFLTANWFDAAGAVSPTTCAPKRALSSSSASAKAVLPRADLHGSPCQQRTLRRRKSNGIEAPADGPYHDRAWPQRAETLPPWSPAWTRTSVACKLRALSRPAMDENTLVIFTSDNGPHREGGDDPDFFNSPGPLRGIKRDLYEGGIRVPYHRALAWPGCRRARPAIPLPPSGISCPRRLRSRVSLRPAAWTAFPCSPLCPGKPADHASTTTSTGSFTSAGLPSHTHRKSQALPPESGSAHRSVRSRVGPRRAQRYRSPESRSGPSRPRIFRTARTDSQLFPVKPARA